MTNTVTKDIIIEHIIKTVGLNKAEAKIFVNNYFETMKETLESGVDIKLSGFGSYGLNDKAERPGRNPKTGEDVAILARRVVTFKAGQKLKAKVENNLPATDQMEK